MGTKGIDTKALAKGFGVYPLVDVERRLRSLLDRVVDDAKAEALEEAAAVCTPCLCKELPRPCRNARCLAEHEAADRIRALKETTKP